MKVNPIQGAPKIVSQPQVLFQRINFRRKHFGQERHSYAEQEYHRISSQEGVKEEVINCWYQFRGHHVLNMALDVAKYAKHMDIRALIGPGKKKRTCYNLADKEDIEAEKRDSKR